MPSLASLTLKKHLSLFECHLAYCKCMRFLYLVPLWELVDVCYYHHLDINTYYYTHVVNYSTDVTVLN